MNKIFGRKDKPIKDYIDFWDWFEHNERAFFDSVKNHRNIEVNFFDKLSPKLEELRDGYFYLSGMYDDNTAELIITVDGVVKNIIFVEELVAKAPKIDGWKFTALKPASEIENVNIEMAGYEFNSENLFFYPNDLTDYPDEIDITIVHNDLNEENRAKLSSGVHIFLDNYLGELDYVSNIDNINIIGKHEIQKDLVPISKLKEFLTWRQKEFIEKYNAIRYNTENDEHSILEAELESGNWLVAVINTQLLNWIGKASHPWIATITFKYDGSKTNGMPNDGDYQKLDEVEDKIMKQLLDKHGYLNIGRQTAKGERDIYFACKEFRKPSKVFFQIQQEYANRFEVEFTIYKDKYWQSFERFNQH